MTDRQPFLRSIEADPNNADLHDVFADWLEEDGDAVAARYHRERMLTLRVIADPASDAPRLEYARVLRENNWDVERAEFIRVQCELAENQDIANQHKGNPDEQTAPCPECVRFNILRRRERDLLKANVGGWVDGLPDPFISKPCPHCVDAVPDYETNAIECRRCDGIGLLFCDDNFEFRRGFVESVTCTAADWLAHGDAILREQPVRRVTLTTRPPLANRHFDNDDYVLPMLMGRWPGIEFMLPPAMPPSHPNSRSSLLPLREGEPGAYPPLCACGERARWYTESTADITRTVARHIRQAVETIRTGYCGTHRPAGAHPVDPRTYAAPQQVPR